MAEKAKMRRKWVLKPTHAEWCRAGVLFRHENVVDGKLEICSWCARCRGEMCPRCHPDYYSASALVRRARASRGLR